MCGKYKLIRNDKKLNEKANEAIINHVNSLKSINSKDSEIIEFKDLSNLINIKDKDNERICKDLYYLLQEEHISLWIQQFSTSGFEFSTISDSAIKLKHKEYKNYYIFWFNTLKISEYSDSGEKCSSTHFVDNRIFNYLINENYMLPLLWFNKIVYISPDTITAREILSYFNNIILKK